jgi:alkylated DNA repair dioxygenase AlkB
MGEIPKGLYFMYEVITEKEEEEIIKWLDEQEWSTVLKRRTQHYGYEYNYNSKDVKRTKEMSGPILQLSAKLSKIMNAQQCIVNEYTEQQGISPHIDSDMFGPIIVGLSIGADCNMIFTADGKERYVAYLPRRSFVLLQDDARHLWKHSIPMTKYVITSDGKKVKSSDYRRISLTYRTIK